MHQVAGQSTKEICQKHAQFIRLQLEEQVSFNCLIES